MENQTEAESPRKSLKERLAIVLKSGRERFLGWVPGLRVSPPVPLNEHSTEVKTLDSVIENIDPRIPKVFKVQAQKTAEYIKLLGQGLDQDDPDIRRFVDQLKGSDFILNVYSPYPFNEGVNPKEALLFWLQYNNRPVALSDQEEKHLSQAFSDWVTSQRFEPFTSEDGQKYYHLDKSQSKVPEPRRFKCYVIGNIMLALKEGRVTKVFARLKKDDLNPDQMKLFEGGQLTLYYKKDVDQSSQVRQAFQSQGLDIRGPAQDVYEVKPTSDGLLKMDVRNSNDGALGAFGHSPIKYRLTKYDSAEFLDNYLQLCLFAGKDPSEPYKTSFVYFVDTDEVLKDNPQLQVLTMEAQRMAGYPVLYTRHRLDIAKK